MVLDVKMPLVHKFHLWDARPILLCGYIYIRKKLANAENYI